jgi:hypothetical protein
MSNNNVKITSYFQSGGITAHTVNVGIQQRHINNELTKQLDSLLTTHKNNKIDISSSLGDGEALSFADEIENYLKSKGYDVHGGNQVVWSRPIRGQEISFEDDGTVSIRIGSNIN